jgi:hypothetical protein
MNIIRGQAEAAKISSEEYIRQTVLSAAHRAEYLAEMNRRIARMNEGKFRYVTDEELEALAGGN